jgi:riboflavin synthase
MPSSRLGGHFVQGHVDGTGVVKSFDAAPGGWRLVLDAPPDATRYIAAKGSLAVAGVSLTVARLDGAAVEVAVIPYTYEHTTLKDLHPGDVVNLEVDLLAKYAQRVSPAPVEGRLSEEWLTELGYDV